MSLPTLFYTKQLSVQRVLNIFLNSDELVRIVSLHKRIQGLTLPFGQWQ